MAHAPASQTTNRGDLPRFPEGFLDRLGQRQETAAALEVASGAPSRGSSGIAPLTPAIITASGGNAALAWFMRSGGPAPLPQAHGAPGSAPSMPS